MDSKYFKEEFIQACEKGDRERADALCLEYMQAISDKILDAIKPVSKEGAPFVIAALEMAAEAVGQAHGQEAVELSHEIRENVEYAGVAALVEDEQP